MNKWLQFPNDLTLNFLLFFSRTNGWSQGFDEFLGILKRARNDHSKFSYAKAKVNYVVCFLKHQLNQLQRHRNSPENYRCNAFELCQKNNNQFNHAERVVDIHFDSDLFTHSLTP